MNSLMWIYEAVKAKLPSGYENVFYQYMREDQVGDVGIYLYEGQNDQYTVDGSEVFNCVKVHVQVNADKSVEGLAKALDYLTLFVNKMESEQCDLSNITFVSVNHLGPKAVPIGRNKFDIQVVKCDIDLKYIFEE